MTTDEIIAKVSRDAIATAQANTSLYTEETIRCADVKISKRTESPIERILFVAYAGLLAATKDVSGNGGCGRYRGLHIFHNPGPLTLDDVSSEHAEMDLSLPEFDYLWEYDFIAPQVKVGSFRADAIIGCRVSDMRFPTPFLEMIAVECDGHDFHEKTKEQAQKDKSRDRFFQSINLPVIRFTGSEIWANPMKCADSIDSILSATCYRETINRMRHSR